MSAAVSLAALASTSRHATRAPIRASARPSPRPAPVMSAAVPVRSAERTDGLNDPLSAGQDVIFQDRAERNGHVAGGHPGNRGVKKVKAAVPHGGSYFSPEPAALDRLVHDYQPVGMG